MQTDKNLVTKIVISVTSIVLLSACGQTALRADSERQMPVEASFSEPTQEPLAQETLTQAPEQQKPVVKKKKAKKHLASKAKNAKKGKKIAQQKSVAAPAQVQPEPLPMIEPAANQQLDSSMLPLSAGSIEVPAPPMAEPPIYEGVNADHNQFLMIGAALIGLIAATMLIVRRRRNRGLIFN